MGNRLPPTHDHPQAHPTPAPTNKRESRTLHQDPAHRMGPRPPLPLKRAAPKRPKLLPQPLQPTTPTPRPQRPHTTPTAVNNLPGTHTWFGSVSHVRVRALRVVGRQPNQVREPRTSSADAHKNLNADVLRLALGSLH